jgi:hypothetical protein
MRRNGHVALGWEVSIRTRTDGQLRAKPQKGCPVASLLSVPWLGLPNEGHVGLSREVLPLRAEPPSQKLLGPPLAYP